jgi:magnesium transporter
LPANPGIRVKGLKGCTDVEWQGQRQNVWVDVESPTPEQIEDLRRHFAFNHLALEDALQIGHWGRFEAYQEHLFLIFRTLAEPEDVTDRTERISIFLFPDQNALVTIRNEPVTYLEAIWKETNSFSERSPMDIIYALLQRGTDTFFTYLDELEERTDDIERRVFASQTGKRLTNPPGQSQPLYEEIFALKQTMINARRLASSGRENIAQFSRHAVTVSPEGAIYLRDVVDHLARVYDGLDTARDVQGSLLDVHLNVQNQRLNEVMRTLTTVSTIFLPLTFIAGIWGMNFEFQPEFNWRFGYAMAWTVFVIVGVSLMLYFKRRGWW